MRRKIVMLFGFIFILLLVSGCAQKKDQVSQGTKETKPQSQTSQGAQTTKSQSTNTDSEEEQPQSPPMAPDFTALDQNGEEIKLSDLRGKVVFLNFWGTWCPPCREEMPAIQKVYEKYSEERDDVAFLGVNDLTIPKEKSMDGVIQWLEDNEYSFPIAFDQEGTISQDYGIQAVPTTFMIDKKGRIYGYVSGALEEEDMIDIIEQTLSIEN